jgi:hypothetical protein
MHGACTPSKQRQLVVNWEYEKLQKAMRERMSHEGAQARYHQRMATVEPVFSYLEDSMVSAASPHANPPPSPQNSSSNCWPTTSAAC